MTMTPASPPPRRPAWRRGGSGRRATGLAPAGAGNGPRTWRARAVSPRGAAVLLAACALFAGAVAGIQHQSAGAAAGASWPLVPYALAALTALAGRPGRRIAVAVSLAGALIVPLAWMAWTGRGQPEVSVVIHSAALFLHHGHALPGRARRGHRAHPVRLQPLPAGPGRVRGPARALRRRPADRSPAVVRGGVRARVRGHAGHERRAPALAVDGGGHRLAHHRVPAHHGRRRPARAGPDLRGPGPAAGCRARPGEPAPACRGRAPPRPCRGSSSRAWPWAWPRP